MLRKIDVKYENYVGDTLLAHFIAYVDFTMDTRSNMKLPPQMSNLQKKNSFEESCLAKNRFEPSGREAPGPIILPTLNCGCAFYFEPPTGYWLTSFHSVREIG